MCVYTHDHRICWIRLKQSLNYVILDQNITYVFSVTQHTDRHHAVANVYLTID